MAKKVANPFFNPNVKKKFLAVGAKNSSRKALLVASAPTEERLGKDLYEFTPDEVKAFLDSYISTASTFELAIKTLQKYTEWNLSERRHPIMSPDDFKSITYEPYDLLRREMVKDPADLSEVLLQTFGEPMSGTQNGLARCYVWLVYIGYSGFDATRVRNEHINFETRTIRLVANDGLSEPVIKIKTFPAEAVADIAEACSMRIVQKKNADGHVVKEEHRIKSTRILRSRSRKTFDDKFYQLLCGQALRDANRDETLSSIIRSGEFFRMYEQEQAGEEIDFDEIIKQSTSIRRPSYIKQFSRYLQIDYKNWKVAFELG